MRTVFIFLGLWALICKAQNRDSLVFDFLPVKSHIQADFPYADNIEYWDFIKGTPPDSIEDIYPSLSVEDFDLSSHMAGQTLFINDLSQLQFEGSVLFTGKLRIWLQSSLVLDTRDGGNRGVLDGIVKNGKKDGEWVLKYSGEEGWPVTKKMNYKNGLLHGDYFVFTHEGEVISYQQSSEKETAATSTFENGTGWYVDFYNFPPYQIKVRGRLVNGQKDGRWNVYDKNGDIIVSYIYQNGIIVNL